MTTMMLSPIQPNKDYLTREEFRNHDQYMKDGFEKVFEQVDNVEIILTDRIDALEVRMDKRFDSVDKRLNSIDATLGSLTTQVDSFAAQVDSLATQVTLLTKITTKIADKL